MWAQIARGSRRVSELATMMDHFVTCPTRTAVGQSDNLPGETTTPLQSSTGTAHPALSGSAREKRFTLLAAPFAAELRRRMGMAGNQLLPDFVPIDKRPLQNG
ncbi:hypothetical protein [Sporisorium scitamineum]|uniref:Uncharacterized protein n=1 Tax=Sporisorium scitamineum TaxID=49012 RepID=A0A0F7RVI6_9BASI|nr:hypothetical protein [Sporisorium scitamineum]